ncbi:excinuclease ABC subunit C [Vibrio ponticus]|nr:excinuclease ABC subunit C [Vibrio ponticus]
MYNAEAVVIYVGKAKDLKNAFPATSVSRSIAKKRALG